MSKVLIIDDKKSIDVEVPAVIIHLSNMLNLAVTSQEELPLLNDEWDDAYAYIATYFEEMYCALNGRNDIDEISAEFVVTSDEDTARGIVITVSIVDFTNAKNKNIC